MHISSHTVLYNPDGLIEADLPLDREPYEYLVKAVLAWTGEDTLAVRDYEQIDLQLTGHARAVASDVRRRANQLPKNSGPWALADVVLREAEARLSATLEGTVHCVQDRARLVRALYERLDRLEAALPRRGLHRRCDREWAQEENGWWSVQRSRAGLRRRWGADSWAERPSPVWRWGVEPYTSGSCVHGPRPIRCVPGSHTPDHPGAIPAATVTPTKRIQTESCLSGSVTPACACASAATG